MKKLSDDIAKRILKTKVKIADYTRLTIDPDVPADNAEIVLLGCIINTSVCKQKTDNHKKQRKKWPLYYIDEDLAEFNTAFL